jgi:predicted metal-dependent hydrolase
MFWCSGYWRARSPTATSLSGKLWSRANDGETDSCFRRLSLNWTQGDLHEGLRCFHSGAFFEAHEHWESVWLAAQEPDKTFLQGLIQVAASFHHFQRGNYAGTISLLRSALRRLNAYPEAFAGVAVAPLRATIRLWLCALETPSRSPLPPLPQLQIAITGSFSSNPVSR